MGVKYGLPPVADRSTRLFILGSLPGERSLQEGRYYAFPTNQFWRLVGSAIGEALHDLDYEDRLLVLRERGIGLWDVISAAQREGSGDQAIRGARLNDIGGLRSDYPELRAVAFNGGRAARDGFRLLAGTEGLELLALPSSSAAYARMSLAEKCEAWSRLAQYCAPAQIGRR